LKYHGLIQAFSRTNRILNEQKSQGNIVCFRNLKKSTDNAIALFSNKDAKETILVEPYESYVTKFNKSFSELLNIVPTVKSVDSLASEDDELAFIKSFRDLMRVKNVLSSFADFNFEDLAMNEQSFEDYKSKYLDLHDKVKGEHDKEKVSILDDVDFELELIHRDDINVAYILKLLANLKDSKPSDREKQKKTITDLLSGDIKLRSKKKLIEKFINENVLNPEDSENVEENFESFWDEEKQKAIALICEEEGIEADKLQEVIGNYIYTERTPVRDEIVDILKVKPKIRERKTIAERIISKIKDFVETFIDGIGG
jgi:type I restriction enzyme R subunit